MGAVVEKIIEIVLWAAYVAYQILDRLIQLWHRLSGQE